MLLYKNRDCFRSENGVDEARMLEVGCVPQYLINTKQGKSELTMKHLILLHDQHWKLTFCMYKLSLGCQIKSNTCMVPVQVPMLELVHLPGKITIGLGALKNHSFFLIMKQDELYLSCQMLAPFFITIKQLSNRLFLKKR